MAKPETRTVLGGLRALVDAACRQDSGLGFSEEDRTNLRFIVDRLDLRPTPPFNLNAIVHEHPALEAAVGYYASRLSFMSGTQEDAEEDYTYELKKHYSAVQRQSGKARVTKEGTEALVHSDDGFKQMRLRTRHLAHLADVLHKLHGAYTRRARLLEQASNNDRQNQRMEET